MSFSDYTIAKVNSFLGLKSIDPFVTFDEFLEQNHKNLKTLLEEKLILVFDLDENEVDISLVEKNIIDFYEKINSELSIDPRNIIGAEFYSKNIQKKVEKMEILDSEEKDMVAHRNNLIKTLNECVEGDKNCIQEGIDLANLKIKKMFERRKSLLFSINKQLKI
jgi:hypothetical protein